MPMLLGATTAKHFFEETNDLMSEYDRRQRINERLKIASSKPLTTEAVVAQKWSLVDVCNGDILRFALPLPCRS